MYDRTLANSDDIEVVSFIKDDVANSTCRDSNIIFDYVAKQIAYDVDLCGGTVYYVGGYVRDQLLDIENKDIDIEVFEITPEKLKEICSQYGKIDEVGESFGVLKIHGYDIDISMPRKERKTIEGHKGFDISVDPYMSVEDAARRRDFTINSIMQNVITGKYVDPFNGISDLKAGILKHIDDKTFVEDPLRVYRAAQFSARFHLRVSPETAKLCSVIDTTSLSPERIFEETNKALLKAKQPSIYFTTLRDINQLDAFFPILKDMIDVRQNPVWHPEGDVWNHTMEVLDKAALIKDKTSYQLGFMYAALFHDIGKVFTTVCDTDGNVHAYNHETVGAGKLHDVLVKITNHKKLEFYVENMILQHMKPHTLCNHGSIKSKNRYFDKCISPRDSILLSYTDTINENELMKFDSGWWDEKIRVYEDMKSKPEVTGKDLINLGYAPGPLFKEILNKCHEIHLAGICREDVLRQIPSIIKGINSRRKS